MMPDPARSSPNHREAVRRSDSGPRPQAPAADPSTPVIGAGDTACVGIDTDRDNLLPALRLAALILRSPVFPADEFEQLRSQSITGLEERKREPGYIADFAMRKHFDPITVDDPDHPALLVAGRIFGGGAKASRLGDRVREKERLSYYVGSGVIVNPEDDTGVFYMQATAAPENMGKVEKAMTEELQRLVRDGITAQELADAKAALLSSYKEARFTDGGIASSLRSNLYMGRTMQWDADFGRAIGSLTVEQVNAAIRRRINPAQISTFIAGDFARVSTRGPVDPAVSAR